MPKVSVIVPVYRVERYIERCARSLFEQTLDDIEYLFIDDCSTDRSIEILKAVLENYPHRKHQVTIHRMEHNSGQAAVREWGMNNAQGRYIIHCDSDDWVDVNMYRVMYEKAMNDNADVVICDYIVTDGQQMSQVVKSCHSTNKDLVIRDFLYQRDPWSAWNKLFRRNLLSEEYVFPKGNMGEDMAICAQLFLHCKSFSYVPHPFYFYFSNPASITRALTKETILRNFSSIKQNTDIVLNEYQKAGREKESGLLYIQYNVKSYLFPIIHQKNYRRLFQNTYPGLFGKMFLCLEFPKKYIIKYCLSFMGLYPRKVNC